jgi:hypothetical protein
MYYVMQESFVWVGVINRKGRKGRRDTQSLFPKQRMKYIKCNYRNCLVKKLLIWLILFAHPCVLRVPRG